MKKRLVIAVLLLAAGAGLLWRARRGRVAGVRPNIVLITLDTTRADRLGCYGNRDGLTPNLDALARRGTVFEFCRTVTPLTLPSHATILSGLYPPEHGLRVNGRRRLAPNIPTLASVLSEAGYATGAFLGSVVLSSRYGLDRAFGVYDDAIERRADAEGASGGLIDHPFALQRPGDEVVDRAGGWMKQAPEPFFCWIHLYDPHDPYDPHVDVFQRRFASHYDAEIAFTDLQVGRVAALLAGKGIEKRTAVVVVADHGEDLYEHGEATHAMTVYDTTMRVPLIISQPSRIEMNRRVQEPVSVVDVYPTLLDLAGVSAPVAAEAADAEQRQRPGAGSLYAALTGKSMAGRACYGETEAPLVDCGWAPLRSLVVGRWKYIRTPVVELYDTHRDPRETENLAKALPRRVAAMEERLAEMERAMTARAAERVALSLDERRQLESLGYAAGSASSDGETDDAPDPMTLRDVKTVVRLHAASWEIRNRFVAGDHGEELVAQCRGLIDRSPETGRFHELLGSVLLARGEAVDAAHHLRKAAELCPGDVDILTTLGVSLYKAGDFGEASGHLSAAIKIDPLAARARAVHGAVSVARGDFDAAIRELREALRLDSDGPLAQQYLAEALRGKGLYRECVQHYAEALRLRPRWREPMEGLAWVLATCEVPQVRDAERALPLAWDLCEATKHKDAAALSTLAAAYAAGGRMDRALTVASNALAFAWSEGREGLADRIRECLDSYEAGRPFVDRLRVVKP